MADSNRSLLLRAMSKRRTWALLFLAVYSLLLSSSWSIIISIRQWYSTSSKTSANPTMALGWPTLYASMLYGAVFGLLSMAAALAVAVPAMVVTWISVLVLLAFCGKPRAALVMEGRRITADIARIACKVLLREGNVVAGVCAAASFFALLVRRKGGDGEEQQQFLR